MTFFCGNPVNSKETEALHYSGTTLGYELPQCLVDKLEIFL